MGDWSPLGDPGWLRNPDWVLDEELPGEPRKVPGPRNGLPALMPYTYRGTGFSLPAEVTAATPARCPEPREATALDDPALRYGTCPVSAPAWWIRDHDKGDL